jgi:hypothetical protein
MGRGVGDPILTKGQKLWYSMFTIITLRAKQWGERERGLSKQPFVQYNLEINTDI